jgi:hypothetical protein
MKLSQLKRKDVRALLFEDEYGQVHRLNVFDTHDREGVVEIFNPTRRQRSDLMSMLAENYDPETKSLNLNDTIIYTKLIPMLTNIDVDTDDVELVAEVLADPSDLLLEVNFEIQGIIESVAKEFVRLSNSMAKLPKDQVKKMIMEEALERKDKLDATIKE